MPALEFLYGPFHDGREPLDLLYLLGGEDLVKGAPLVEVLLFQGQEGLFVYPRELVSVVSVPGLWRALDDIAVRVSEFLFLRYLVRVVGYVPAGYVLVSEIRAHEARAPVLGRDPPYHVEGRDKEPPVVVPAGVFIHHEGHVLYIRRQEEVHEIFLVSSGLPVVLPEHRKLPCP